MNRCRIGRKMSLGIPVNHILFRRVFVLLVIPRGEKLFIDIYDKRFVHMNSDLYLKDCPYADQKTIKTCNKAQDKDINMKMKKR